MINFIVHSNREKEKKSLTPLSFRRNIYIFYSLAPIFYPRTPKRQNSAVKVLAYILHLNHEKSLAPLSVSNVTIVVIIFCNCFLLPDNNKTTKSCCQNWSFFYIRIEKKMSTSITKYEIGLAIFGLPNDGSNYALQILCKFCWHKFSASLPYRFLYIMF